MGRARICSAWRWSPLGRSSSVWLSWLSTSVGSAVGVAGDQVLGGGQAVLGDLGRGAGVDDRVDDGVRAGLVGVGVRRDAGGADQQHAGDGGGQERDGPGDRDSRRMGASLREGRADPAPSRCQADPEIFSIRAVVEIAGVRVR